MKPSIPDAGAGDVVPLEVLWQDGERVFCRVSGDEAGGERRSFMAVVPATENPSTISLDRLTHEFGLKDHLDAPWAVRPLDLVRDHGRTMLVLDDPGAEPLQRLLGAPMELSGFLRLAAALAAALRGLHERGLIHKDINPANVLVDAATNQVWLTGFGVASRLPRERQAPTPPEFIAGSLPYMAPEQTGRMNRSIDSRSDLYSLGVTLYEMSTGRLPFTASDPMEWVHCQIARQPVSPRERAPGVPRPVSAIIMKLLAKTAEDRYQTAAGLERDLERCLQEWDADGRIDAFPLGEHDTPDRLLIPEKLYGRASEINTLLAAFDHVVGGGRPELVLVSGYSGVGKSSVVNELHKPLVLPHSLFAAGKFDQHKRDIPYATLAQAFQHLVRLLLAKSDAELDNWRGALSEALGPDGQLIVDLVPELQFIIGEQPPMAELPPRDAQRRFQRAFHRFLTVFARPEHPLVLFLDDLQWLDAATLDLLEHLLTQTEVRHVLFVAAYRDNEVTPAHPLLRSLDRMRVGAPVRDIVLAPLKCQDVGELIADSLRCGCDAAAPLAELVHGKTDGNPFFVIQFLKALVDEGLLAFDHGAARWSWDLSRIHAKGYTDNIADLMVGKLGRLPIRTLTFLQQLACLGASAEAARVAMVCEGSDEDLGEALQEALQTELVFQSEDALYFLHDRVQEAAYTLIPEPRRAAAHLRIGRLLAARAPPGKLDEWVFEIVNQLNRGAGLITSPEEKMRLAELNLIAGKRARVSAAHASALSYLVAGAAILPGEGWDHRPDLMFALEIGRAECEFLTGELSAAETRLAALSARAASPVDRAAVACLGMDLYTTLHRVDRAVEVCLDYLRLQGMALSAHPTDEEVREEYERIWSLLGRRQIEDLIDLPVMSDPDSLTFLDVLTKGVTPAAVMDLNLLSILICRAVNLSIERGNTDASSLAYAQLGAVAGPSFHDYEAGFRFGQLGCALTEQRGMRRLQARTYYTFGLLLPWFRPVRESHDLFRRAFDAANLVSDLPCAVNALIGLEVYRYAAGDPLSDVQSEVERSMEFARNARSDFVIDSFTPTLSLIRTLRGATPIFGCFDSAEFDELRFERHLASDARFVGAAYNYWNRKLQARFFAGNYVEAVKASLKAQPLLWTARSFKAADTHYFGALAHAASCDAASSDDYRGHCKALIMHHEQLVEWAENCPENFANRAALTGAEIARLEGRTLDAEHLYEVAIKSARENGLVHNEAIANELAARFYAARGYETIAHAYLGNARDCYRRWGADGKVRQLDERYRHPREGRTPIASATTGPSLGQLDLETVVKASQALSSEMVLPRLIEQLMRIAVEHAGAERGVLILVRDGEPRIEAEATTGLGEIGVAVRHAAITPSDLPQSVLHYTIRTQERVLLDDASSDEAYSLDDYVRLKRSRSVLCLPIVKQAKLVGALYLENSLTPGAFTPERVAVLELLASQAAISLENAALYADLQRSEAFLAQGQRISQTGTFGWSIAGGEFYWSAENYNILEYDRGVQASADLALERMHPDDRDSVRRLLDDARREKKDFDSEHRLLMPDGRVKHVHTTGRAVSTGGLDFVGAVRDVTERVRAEKAARESERQYHEIQLQLAHANRVETLGHLSASIAHELNQPLSGAVLSAETGLLWLSGEQPNIPEAQKALARVVRDGNRAGEVFRRIRTLIKKAPPQKDSLDINEVTLEIVGLAQGEAANSGVQMRTRLQKGLPLIQGDRVQLQQVILNLIMNALDAIGSRETGPREILISTASTDSGDIHVSVQDSGPGVDPATIDRIFDAFYTTKADGLGMGLSICRSIIEAHGGKLWATTGSRRGAIFQFTVPVVEPEGS